MSEQMDGWTGLSNQIPLVGLQINVMSCVIGTFLDILPLLCFGKEFHHMCLRILMSQLIHRLHISLSASESMPLQTMETFTRTMSDLFISLCKELHFQAFLSYKIWVMCSDWGPVINQPCVVIDLHPNITRNQHWTVPIQRMMGSFFIFVLRRVTCFLAFLLIFHLLHI